MSMEPMMREKRQSAELLPYRREGGILMFYLQKRDAGAQRAPGRIALFGGGIEGNETIEENLERELKEELNYVATNPIYFSKYETAKYIAHIFIEEVDEDFESKVKVSEGEYGLFLPYGEVQAHPEVTTFTKLVVMHVTEMLAK